MIGHKDVTSVRDFINKLSYEIIGACIEVHSHLGPGLLESAYEQCLCKELSLKGLSYDRQVALPLEYKGMVLDCGYRMDIVVEDMVVLELKSVEEVLPIHDAQMLTYLKLSDKKLGMIINFNVSKMKNGIKRLVNNL